MPVSAAAIAAMCHVFNFRFRRAIAAVLAVVKYHRERRRDG